MRLIVRVDDEEVVMGLRRAAAAVQKDANREVAGYAQRHVVPTARTLAPRIIADTITARAAAKGVWITTTARGKRRAIVGVTNFGGTIRTPILPRKRKAIRMPDGRFVSAVRTPRTIQGKHYLEAAVERHQAGLRRELTDALTSALQRRIVGIA